MGLEPRSTLVKAIHCLLGGTGLGATVCYMLGLAGAWRGVLACAVLGLWYLPFGTVLGLIQVGLLCKRSVRGEPAR